MLNLDLRRDAQQDLASAARWYESEQVGLGKQFLIAVGELHRRIAAAPQEFPKVDGEIRRGLVQRFPYGVYF